MTRDGVPMLADFGVSRAVQYTLGILYTSSFHRIKGTVNWMAPELIACFWAQTQGTGSTELRLTYATDMWAFGMVVYASSHLLFYLV